MVCTYDSTKDIGQANNDNKTDKCIVIISYLDALRAGGEEGGVVTAEGQGPHVRPVSQRLQLV